MYSLCKPPTHTASLCIWSSLGTLGGTPATLLADALREHCVGDKVQSVVVLPLFFGTQLNVFRIYIYMYTHNLYIYIYTHTYIPI